MKTAPVTNLASDVHLLASKHTGRSYRITISLPLGYSSPPDERWPFNNMPAAWPVVYVLDGNWYHGLVTGIIRPMVWCGSTTDAIVVGIGYPEGQDAVEAFRESVTRRIQDLGIGRCEEVEKMIEAVSGRPTPVGDAGNFHRFIKDELIPFVEGTYRAEPTKRILVGHSLGGLFGLFGMFESPDLFDTLILGSPSVFYSDHFILQREAAYAKEHKQLPARIFLFVGDLEESVDDPGVSDMLRLAAILQSRKYEGLTLVRQIFLDQNHCEVAALGFQAGLKFALRSR